MAVTRRKAEVIHRRVVVTRHKAEVIRRKVVATRRKAAEATRRKVVVAGSEVTSSPREAGSSVFGAMIPP